MDHLEHCLDERCFEKKEFSSTMVVIWGMLVAVAFAILVAIFIPGEQELVQMGYGWTKRYEWTALALIFPICASRIISWCKSASWCRHCPVPEEKKPEDHRGFPYVV